MKTIQANPGWFARIHCGEQDGDPFVVRLPVIAWVLPDALTNLKEVYEPIGDAVVLETGRGGHTERGLTLASQCGKLLEYCNSDYAPLGRSDFEGEM